MILIKVVGSERKGRVIENDVKSFVALKSNNVVKNENKDNEKIKQEYSHEEFGEVEKKDLPRIKKIIIKIFDEFMDKCSSCDQS